ncbi:YolA family protein [Pseudomonas sp. 13B_2.1_Bac1]|uniref:YolA family protein n=1 Tax=Pseudomonas sp. 13B_2.1_Bac1 TaxID=2971624 RepID=UPI0021CAD022|nr:YolA family protein [Pseudomonas sp. 13B_2.1_Bac1]MCU1786021.1 YolA family protein [Pseudomonas sp. 13B_2.1_Bac1]
MKKANASSLALFAIIGLWLSAAPAWGATAPALSEVRVFKVQSAACTETIPERAASTQMCTHRGQTLVYVMEVGLGNSSQAFFDGAPVSGSSTPICQVGSISQACSGAGTVMGYIYAFQLNISAGGTFQYSNTSINPPRNQLVTTLSIR